MKATQWVLSGFAEVDLERFAEVDSDSKLTTESWIPKMTLFGILDRDESKIRPFMYFVAANTALILDHRLYTVIVNQDSVQVNSIDKSKHLGRDAWSALCQAVDKAAVQVG